MNVLITGGTGLVGKAIEYQIYNDKDDKFKNFCFKFVSSKLCDLTNLQDTQNLFETFKPYFVIHLAAYVGGLYKNMNFKVDMFEINTLINFNVLKCCHDYKVKKCVSCLSTCIFPDKTEYPISEKMLHDGPPHDSNYPYAYAKRMLAIHSKAYYEQYGDKFVTIIPTNIYGPHDNFSLENGHVIPSLIHKCYLAKLNNKPFVVRGSGKPLRQFIHSYDLANLILWSLENYEESEPIILSVGEDDEVSIKDVATQIARSFEYENKMTFDASYSDGQYKKTADNKKLMSRIKNYNFIPIQNGISETVTWFQNNYESTRK